MDAVERIRKYTEIKRRIEVARKAKSVTASAYREDIEFLMEELDELLNKKCKTSERKPIDWEKVKGWFFREQIIPASDGYEGVKRGELPVYENYGYDPKSNR